LDSPWPLLRSYGRTIATAALTALVLLVVTEVLAFRSGLFTSHVHVSSPDSPNAKLALLGRFSDARVLYFGDSIVLTDVAPVVVSESCRCGPGFNAAFSSATTWLTAVMISRTLEIAKPQVVVVGAAPYALDDRLRLQNNDLARELLRPDEFASFGAALDLFGRAQWALGSTWSVYGQRALFKEFLNSLLPGQRYDESKRGLLAPPGAANSPSQLSTQAEHLKALMPGAPSLEAPSAQALVSALRDVRARGMKVVIMLPPVHPVADAAAPPYLAAANSVIHDIAKVADAEVMDCRDAVDASDFRDLTHLNPTGAAKFSRCVGDYLARLMTIDHAVQ